MDWKTAVVLTALALNCGCIREAADNPATTTTLESVTAAGAPSTTTTQQAAAPTPTTTMILTTLTTTTTILTATTTIQPTTSTLNPLIRTFTDNGGEICRVDGKPVVRMYSKTACHNCEWSIPIFDKVALEYAGKCLIAAHRWVFDRNDDALTESVENRMPDLEYDVFFEDSGNPSKTVPYFNFGCRFTRVGNGYQVRDTPRQEEAEYRAVIEQLIQDGG